MNTMHAPPDNQTLEHRLTPPTTRIPVVLDTDSYNEIDDQFALVYTLLSPQQIDLQAILAAPFHNNRSTSPADGMAKSYDEIVQLLNRMNRTADHFVYHGATQYLPAADQPADNPAAHRLIELAMQDRTTPLYVAAIAALTNIASAILIEPRIIHRIVIVWLGGQPRDWPINEDFNLRQDPHAARVVLNCGAPLVRIPCVNVAEQLRTTVPELALNVTGRGDVGDYLFDIFQAYCREKNALSRPLWDVAPIAWLIHADWTPSILTPSPVLNHDLTWSNDPTRHTTREITRCERDPIFDDMFNKLTAQS